MTARARVIAANIETAKTSPPLAERIKNHKPDAVVVEQAYRAGPWLNSIDGYRVWQYQGQESRGIAVLVRDDVRLEHRRALQMRQKWTGPKAGRPHQPRTYPALRLVKDGVMFRLLGIHFPTHNNPAAQDESKQAVAHWFTGDAPSLAVGDWNLTDRELAPFAHGLGVQLVTAGKVDHGIAGNAHATVARLPTAAGAHGWALYTLDLRP